MIANLQDENSNLKDEVARLRELLSVKNRKIAELELNMVDQDTAGLMP
jgi:hypothetical protein